MGIIKMSPRRFNLFLLPTPRFTGFANRARGHSAPLGARTGTATATATATATRAAPCVRREGDAQHRGPVVASPGREPPAPAPSGQGCTSTAPALAPHISLLAAVLLHSQGRNPRRSSSWGLLFLLRVGEACLLFILLLFWSGHTVNSVLVLIHSSSQPLLAEDFYCYFFFLLLDCFSACASCALFQLVFASCISAMKFMHPSSITAPVPLISPDAARRRAKICSAVIWYNCCDFSIIFS